MMSLSLNLALQFLLELLSWFEKLLRNVKMLQFDFLGLNRIQKFELLPRTRFIRKIQERWNLLFSKRLFQILLRTLHRQP